MTTRGFVREGFFPFGLRWALRGILLLLTLGIYPTVAAADIVLNFDPVDASAGAVTANCYLAGFGICTSGVSQGTQVAIQKRFPLNSALVPPSPPNTLEQQGSNDPVSYRLNFGAPVNSVKFTRPMLLAGSSGITFPQWSAHAFNASGVEVSSVGENLIQSFSTVPAKVFIERCISNRKSGRKKRRQIGFENEAV